MAPLGTRNGARQQKDVEMYPDTGTAPKQREGEARRIAPSPSASPLDNEPSEVFDSLETILREVERIVYARVFPASLAEEVYSEALVRVAESLKRFDPARGVPLRAWIFKAVRWTTADVVRATLRHPVEELPEALPSPRTAHEAFELREALCALPCVEREVLIGYAYREPMATLSKRLRMPGFEVAAYREIAIRRVRAYLA